MSLFTAVIFFRQSPVLSVKMCVGRDIRPGVLLKAAPAAPAAPATINDTYCSGPRVSYFPAVYKSGSITNGLCLYCNPSGKQ